MKVVYADFRALPAVYQEFVFPMFNGMSKWDFEVRLIIVKFLKLYIETAGSKQPIIKDARDLTEELCPDYSLECAERQGVTDPQRAAWKRVSPSFESCTINTPISALLSVIKGVGPLVLFCCGPHSRGHTGEALRSPKTRRGLPQRSSSRHGRFCRLGAA